ncbi:MAG: hypothetical protein AABY51_03260 [Deltaproteobacteria bacterium]
MGKKTFIKLAAAFAVCFAFSLPWWGIAGHLVLDRVEIMNDAGCAEIDVSFNFPVRYVRHFPAGSGSDLRIQVEPIVTSEADRSNIATRETIQPDPDHLSTLEKIVYEGDEIGGPFLSFYFNTDVAFKVEQGPDYRSLVIWVADKPVKDTCFQGR